MIPKGDFLHFLNSDRYQYTECDVFLAEGLIERPSVFDFFFRKTEDGGFAVVAGVYGVVQLIRTLNETGSTEKRAYFSKVIKEPALLDYLCNMTFTGNIYAMREGEITFPYEPIIVVEGALGPAKLLETPLLNTMNYQMAIASKASRVTRAAHPIPVLAFGPRRAHGPDAAIMGTRAALIAGCAGHSSLAGEYIYGEPSTGTMSHAFIQSFGVGARAERTAFDAFIATRKKDDNALILLIDTYDTLQIGVINAIDAFKAAGIDDDYPGAYGIRIDSGDLAYLSKRCRKLFDQAGLFKAGVVLSNGLDEHIIAELRAQDACATLFGVGDAVAVSRDNPAFGGVYKMTQINGEPVIKVSGDAIKCLTPHKKDIYRIYQQGEAKADIICLDKNDANRDALLAGQAVTITAEHNRLMFTELAAGSYTVKPLLVPMIVNGEPTPEAEALSDVKRSRAYYLENLACFSEECKRLVNPHQYKVDLSVDLYDLKRRMIKEALLTEERKK